jgi:hypothetical protein
MAYAMRRLTCEWCGREFFNEPRRRFCSRSCAANRYNNKYSDEDAEVVFWCHVRSSRDSCWEWQHRLNHCGYGAFIARVNGIRYHTAHRYSYAVHNGITPPGLCVCHKCDNPRCVRPDHLFLGSHLDNARDRDRKGRAATPRGSRNGSARLTEAAVIDIRRRYENREASQGELAREYGVHIHSVHRVIRRISWSHI